MAIALVQMVGNNGNTAAATGTLAGAPTNGNLLVIVAMLNAAYSGFTGVPSGFTDAVHKDNSSTGLGIGIWYKVASSDPATLSFTNTSTNWGISIYEFSGCPTVLPLDTTTSAESAAGTTANYQIGSLTPGATNQVFVGGVAQAGANGGTEAIDSSFTNDTGNGSRIVAGYKIKTDAVAENPHYSWTTVQKVAGVVATFKVTAGGGGTLIVPDRSYPLGVNRGVLRGVA